MFKLAKGPKHENLGSFHYSISWDSALKKNLTACMKYSKEVLVIRSTLCVKLQVSSCVGLPSNRNLWYISFCFVEAVPGPYECSVPLAKGQTVLQGACEKNKTKNFSWTSKGKGYTNEKIPCINDKSSYNFIQVFCTIFGIAVWRINSQNLHHNLLLWYQQISIKHLGRTTLVLKRTGMDPISL